MVIVKGMILVMLEGCIELFAIVGKRIKTPRLLPFHMSG